MFVYTYIDTYNSIYAYIYNYVYSLDSGTVAVSRVASRRRWYKESLFPAATNNRHTQINKMSYTNKNTSHKKIHKKENIQKGHTKRHTQIKTHHIRTHN